MHSYREIKCGIMCGTSRNSTNEVCHQNAIRGLYIQTKDCTLDAKIRPKPLYKLKSVKS